MIRNLKLLGLMAVAAMAMTAMFATAAQAETEKGTFTAGETPKTHLNAEIFGNQITELESENFFEIGFEGKEAEKFTCKQVAYTGTLTGGVGTEITLAPTFSGCTAKGLLMTITMNGCAYIFTQPNTIAGDSLKRYTGLTDIECPAGKVIEIHVYLSAAEAITVCTLTIPAQTNKSHIVYRNTPAGVGVPKDDLDAEFTVTGLKVERDKGTCGAAATTENGVLQTKVTLRAYKDEAKDETKTQTDLWISDPATP